MKLKIKNFRGITKNEIELPNKGMVNFSGNSEAGKTSLLESIVWAFYGAEGTKNVTPLDGGKKTEVSVQFKDLNIVRTKTPNSLDVDGHQDDAGQGLIDHKIACVNHFRLGSYVQQKMKNCFLNLKPKEQLEFLDKLAFDVDVEVIKQRLRAKEKEVKVKLEESNIKLQMTRDALVAKEEELQALQEGIVAVKNPADDLKMLQKNISIYEGNISDLNDKIKDLEREKTNPLRKLKSSLPLKEDSILHIIKEKGVQEDNIISNIAVKKEDLKLVAKELASDKEKVLNDIDDIKRKIEAARNYVDIRQLNLKTVVAEKEELPNASDLYSERDSIEKKLRAFGVKKIKAESLSIPYDPELVPVVEEQIKDFKQGIKEADENIQNITNQLNNYEKPLVCPSCKAEVRLVSEGLVQNEEASLDVDSLKETVSNLKKEKASLKERLKKAETYMEFHVSCGHIEDVDEEVCNARLEEIANVLLTFNTIQSKVASAEKDVVDAMDVVKRMEEECKKLKEAIPQLEERAEKTFNRIKADIKNLEESVVALEKQTELRIEVTRKEIQEIKDTLTQANLREIEDIDKEIESAKRTIEEIQSGCIAPIKEEAEHVNSLAKKYEEYTKVMVRIEMCEKDLVTLNKNYEEAHKTNGLLLGVVSKHERLKKLINKAQLDALQSITDSINLSAQSYLDHFFPDCGTSIRILPQKINQDGTASDKVGIEIIHRGIKFKSINDFSGGAENRAILAFQLAISDLVGSPILLLDEPLVGVHEDLRDSIYETIRTVASEKLVIVIEHGAKENLFDYVHNLG